MPYYIVWFGRHSNSAYSYFTHLRYDLILLMVLLFCTQNRKNKWIKMDLDYFKLEKFSYSENNHKNL